MKQQKWSIKKIKVTGILLSLLLSLLASLFTFLLMSEAKAEAKSLYGYHCGFYSPCWSSWRHEGHRSYKRYSLWGDRVVRKSNRAPVIRQQKREMRQIRRMIRRNYWEKRRCRRELRRHYRYQRLRRR